MKLFRPRDLGWLAVLLMAAGIGYYYRADLGRFARQFVTQSLPCQTPITYSIGSIDPKFNLTPAQVAAYVAEAEAIWETPVGRQLFVYSPTGDLKINLIYDNRQKATDALKKIGVVLNDDRATYNVLKARHDALASSVDAAKTRIDREVAAFNADQAAYEKDVAYWNSRGGAPKDQYLILEQRDAALNARAAAIGADEGALNSSIDTLNSTVQILNQLITSLNLQVSKYNTVGSSNGSEFNEGQYVSDASGTAIDIYQFDNAAQLVRLFAHELGHALGLEHVSDPKAIMYYLNEGTNEKLTADDLTALKNICRIK